MNKKISLEIAIGIIIVLVFVVGFSFWMDKQNTADSVQQAVTNNQQLTGNSKQVAENSKQEKGSDDANNVQIANPASEFCANNGGKSEIRTNQDGSQTGYCVFENGNECEEWAYMRGDCDNWQTYKNDEIGFEFQYPERLKYELNTNVDYFNLDIGEQIKDDTQPELFVMPIFNATAKNTKFKNTTDWFASFKKDFEKPSDYEGTIIHPKIASIKKVSIDDLNAIKYVPGGGIFPFYNECVGFVKNGFEFSICYTGEIESDKKIQAQNGTDEYGNPAYEENKIDHLKERYRDEFDKLISTMRFVK